MRYCSSQATSNAPLQRVQRSTVSRSRSGTRSRQFGQTPYSDTPGKRDGFLGRGTTDQRRGGSLRISRSARGMPTRSQPGPKASRSHLPLPFLPVVSAGPGSLVRSGWRRAGRPADRVGAWWSMCVAIIALQAGGALRPLVRHPARRPPATLACGPVVEVAAGVAHAELRRCLPLSDPKGLRRPCCGARAGSVAAPPCRDRSTRRGRRT